MNALCTYLWDNQVISIVMCFKAPWPQSERGGYVRGKGAWLALVKARGTERQDSCNGPIPQERQVPPPLVTVARPPKRSHNSTERYPNVR